MARTRRHALDLGARAVGDDLAPPDHHDPVGVGVGLLQVVGGEQDRAAGVGVVADRRPEVPPPLDVHALGRLVEDQQRRVRQQRHGEADPLLLPTGALAHHPPGDVGDPGPPHDLVHRAGGGEQVRGVLDDLGDGQVPQEPAVLHDRRHQAVADRVARVEAEDPGAAGGGRLQAEDQVDGGGLAGTVGPEEGHDLPGGDLQVDAGDGVDVPEPLLDTAQGDGRFPHRGGR
ncbi:MAG TPA: hypothetical protein VFN60_07180 [Acidimicrobiales bacterium]|nr:hypothetical protein [Acidimicrobiales bacterium]